MRHRLILISRIWVFVAAMVFVLSLGLYINKVDSAAEDSSADVGDGLPGGASCTTPTECEIKICCRCGIHEDNRPIGDYCLDTSVTNNCSDYCVGKYNAEAGYTVACGSEVCTLSNGCCPSNKLICSNDPACGGTSSGGTSSGGSSGGGIASGGTGTTGSGSGGTGSSSGGETGSELPLGCGGVEFNQCALGAAQECAQINGFYMRINCALSSNIIGGIDPQVHAQAGLIQTVAPLEEYLTPPNSIFYEGPNGEACNEIASVKIDFPDGNMYMDILNQSISHPVANSINGCHGYGYTNPPNSFIVTYEGASADGASICDVYTSKNKYIGKAYFNISFECLGRVQGTDFSATQDQNKAVFGLNTWTETNQELGLVDEIIYRTSVEGIYYSPNNTNDPDEILLQIEDYVETRNKDGLSASVIRFIETMVEKDICYGDLNTDGKVDLVDLARYAKQYVLFNQEEGALISLSRFAQNYNDTEASCSYLFSVDPKDI